MDKQVLLLGSEARLQQLQLMRANTHLEAEMARAAGDDPAAFEAIEATIGDLIKAERARTRRLLKLMEV